MDTKLKRIAGIVLAALLAAFALAGAQAEEETAYGADAVRAGETYTLEQMLAYALQDERLALAQYRAAAEKFGAGRPFDSLIEAETTHIKELTALMKAKGIAVPEEDAAGSAAAPATLEEALSLGREAEQKNIAMYDVFLAQEGLDGDAKTVFTALKKASEKHLAALGRSALRGARQKGQADAASGATADGGNADGQRSGDGQGDGRQNGGRQRNGGAQGPGQGQGRQQPYGRQRDGRREDCQRQEDFNARPSRKR